MPSFCADKKNECGSERTRRNDCNFSVFLLFVTFHIFTTHKTIYFLIDRGHKFNESLADEHSGWFRDKIIDLYEKITVYYIIPLYLGRNSSEKGKADNTTKNDYYAPPDRSVEELWADKGKSIREFRL